MKLPKIIFIIALSIFLGSTYVHSEDSFHPEADETLKDGKVWVLTTFKGRGSYEGHIAFRAWLPYPAEEVWKVLIDTNNYKKMHSDYDDGRTLDKRQYDLLSQKKPTGVKDFYEIVGDQVFPSYYNRKKGGVWISYVFQKFKFPFPLSDRWNVMKVKNDETKASKGKYHYEYDTLVGNFKTLKGYWELVPVSGKPGWTEWRGKYKIDPGIQYPQFLARTIIRSSLKKSVKSNLKVLEQRKVASKKGN